MLMFLWQVGGKYKLELSVPYERMIAIALYRMASSEGQVVVPLLS